VPFQFLFGERLIMLRCSGLVCAGLLALASTSSHAITTFDTASRAAVASAYTTTYVPLFDIAPGWTGDVATCTAGTTTAAHQQATIEAANFYRVMAGLPQVSLISEAVSSAAVTRARQAALLMAANGNISHFPNSTDFPTCYSTAGAAAVMGAAASNLALGGVSVAGGLYYQGATGPGAIAGYINDPGNGGEIGGELGHRRWILYSKAVGFATGDIPNTTKAVGGNYFFANALRVMPIQTTPTDGLAAEAPSLFWGTGVTQWIAWPSPNFVPYQMMPSTGYWSVSYPGASFTAATTVKMTTAGGTDVPVNIYRLGPTNGSFIGDNTLQFNPTLPAAPAGGMNDTSYKVEVRLAGGTGTPDFCYTVTVFDPAKAGPSDTAPDLCSAGTLLAQSITFTSTKPSTVTVGDTYTPAATGGASGNPVTFTVTGACTLASGQVTFDGFTGLSNSSTCTIKADQAGNGTYSAAPSQTQDITVNRKSQTVTFNASTPTNAVVGDPPYTLAATATSSGTVTFATTSPDTVCTVVAEAVNFIGTGTCTITATQDGNDDWAAASATWPITISSVPLTTQTITFDGTTPTTGYVGTSADLSSHATGGGSGNAVTFTSATSSICSTSGTNGATVTFLAAGNCVVTANQAGDTTHSAAAPVQRTITVSKQSQTITFNTQTTANRPFAPLPPDNKFALDPVATTNATGLSVTYTSTTPAVCSISGTTVTMITGGTCTITASQAGNDTYLPATPVSQSITIDKASQTVTITSVDPSPALVGDTYTVTASASSGLPISSFTAGSATVCTISGAVVTFVGNGNCIVGAVQSGNTSYLSGSGTQTITVKLKQTLTVTSTAPTPPFTVGQTYTMAVDGDIGMLTFASLTPTVCSIDPTTGEVTFLATSGNCTITATADGDVTYAPATVQQTIYLGPSASNGATAVPTLGEWTLALLAALTALLALPALRRRTAAIRR